MNTEKIFSKGFIAGLKIAKSLIVSHNGNDLKTDLMKGLSDIIKEEEKS